MPLQKND